MGPSSLSESLSNQAAVGSGLSPSDLDYLSRLARQAAELGGNELSCRYGRLKHVREKGRSGDLVTEADHAAEEVVLDFLLRETPHIGVLAEESGRHQRPGELEWCVDPLDGTTNYAHGFPFFGTSIGLTWKGIPLLGALAAPALGELYWAAPGMGSWCNDQQLAVTTCDRLEDALLATGFAYDRSARLDNNYAEFAYFTHRTHGVRRAGAAALDLAFVAAGRLDGYWERGLSSWDLAAGVVLVEQAGGVATRYDGSALQLSSGRVIASGPKIHPALVEGLAHCSPLPGRSYGAPELDP